MTHEDGQGSWLERGTKGAGIDPAVNRRALALADDIDVGDCKSNDDEGEILFKEGN